MRAWLDEVGLVAAGRHARLEEIEDGVAAALSRRRRSAPIDGRSAGSAPTRWATLPPSSGASRRRRGRHAAGLRLGFHNHWSELEPLSGRGTFLDLLRELPPDLLWLELDLGWVWQAGADPLSELERTAGRCPLVHVKDYAPRRPRRRPGRRGIVGYEQSCPRPSERGLRWLVVEEDEVGDDPFTAVDRSLQAVRRIIAA